MMFAFFLTTLLSTTAGPATSPRDSSKLRLEPFTFVSEHGDSVPAERGHLFVPENRTRRASRMIELTFIRLRSTARVPGSPIVYLAGGPGGSAQLVATGARFPLFNGLRAAADVIIFDQRGTWGSTNLMCPTAVTVPGDTVLNAGAQLAIWQRWSRGCADYWASNTVDLTGYNSVESVDDIDDVRRALGARRVSLVSISYGTQLAQAFMRRHGASADRVVLAGPEPLDGVIKLPSATDQQITRLDSAMARDSAAHARIPSLRRLIDSVLSALERAPVRTVVRGRNGDSTIVALGKFDVQFVTTFSFGNSTFLKSMPQLYLRMAAGDFSGIAPLVLRVRNYRSTAMAATMDCATGMDSVILARARREAPESVFEMSGNFPYPEICEVWPHRVLGPAFRRVVTANTPVLFVVGSMDGRTPPANADRIRSGLRNSHTLRIDGAAHDDDLLVSDPRIVATMVHFFQRTLDADVRIALPAWVFPMPK